VLSSKGLAENDKHLSPFNNVIKQNGLFRILSEDKTSQK
jgi:hypothetical protein